MKSLKRIIVSLALLSSIFACSSSDDLIGDWAVTEPFQGKGRNGAVTFTLSGIPYVGLGIDQDVIELNDFWKLGEDLTWNEVAPFPGNPRFGAVAFAGQNHAYVGLGYALNDNNIGGQSEYFKDFWRFDPNGTTTDSLGRVYNGSWSQVEDFPGIARRNAIGFAIGTNGYVGTGYGEGTEGHLSDYWKFDMTTEKWIYNDGVYPQYRGKAREGAVVWVIGESAYIALGAAGSDYINDVYKFTPGNPVGQQWKDLERLKSFDKEKWNDDYPQIPRSYGVAFVVGTGTETRAYVTTGAKSGSSAAYDTWEFNPNKEDQGAWEEVTNFPSNAYRVNAVAFTFKDVGYVTVGGTSTNPAQSNTTRVSTYRFFPGIDDDDDNND